MATHWLHIGGDECVCWAAFVPDTTTDLVWVLHLDGASRYVDERMTTSEARTYWRNLINRGYRQEDATGKMDTRRLHALIRD